jgi:hypothetical protein
LTQARRESAVEIECVAYAIQILNGFIGKTATDLVRQYSRIVFLANMAIINRFVFKYSQKKNSHNTRSGSRMFNT